MRSTYIAQKVEVKTEVKGVAVDIAVAGRPFMIANTGAQPLYINPAETATTSNGFLIPAGTVLPIKMAVAAIYLQYPTLPGLMLRCCISMCKGGMTP